MIRAFYHELDGPDGVTRRAMNPRERSVQV